MNLELFDKLYFKKKGNPQQRSPEFRMFLSICDSYLKEKKIKNPIVVELGIFKNRQKKFYEQLLGARHIGIDISVKKSTPDILGDTHDPKTLKRLKKKLKERAIDILFIDAYHRYDDVKMDYEMYSPLCTGIIAFHDIESHKYYQQTSKTEVWKFWDDLKMKAAKNEKDEYINSLFFSIYRGASDMGIGMLIKK